MNRWHSEPGSAAYDECALECPAMAHEKGGCVDLPPPCLERSDLAAAATVGLVGAILLPIVVYVISLGALAG